MNVGDTYNPRRLFRGIFIPESIARMDRKQLSPGAKLAFGWLCWHTDDESGECEPSSTELAQELGVSERQARDYVMQLEREGFIRQVRQGPATNSFEFCWHAVLESCVRKDRNKSSDQRPEQNPEKTGTKVPISLRDKEVYRTTEETPYSPPTKISFETAMHGWNRHRGFKKPNKAMRERLSEKWTRVEIDEDNLALALDGFFASDWARKENYPPLAFVKDPWSWIPAASGEAQQASEPEKVSVPQAAITDAPQPAQTPIDYPAKWNELVPAKPVTWDGRRGPAAALRECEADDVFRDKFEEMCSLAQKIHTLRGAEVDWLTFEFVIRKSEKGLGWWRVLTEFRSMAVEKVPAMRKSPISGHEAIERTLANRRAARAQKAAEGA